VSTTKVRRELVAGLGVAAVGLGIGAAVVATAGNAAADPVSPLDPNVAAWIDGVTGTPDTASVDPFSLPDPSFAVSMSGLTLFQEGSATAVSGPGDIAIAFGTDSDADASFSPSGIGDFAFADGTLSDAIALGYSDVATAVGNFDVATLSGPNSSAFDDNGNFDFASVVNTGSGIDDAAAGGISSNLLGNFDIAQVVGTSSTAIAGASENTAGSFDLAQPFGDMLTAVATGGNFLVDILP
jgi:hypothetical protein